jgi:hypothetical protein
MPFCRECGVERDSSATQCRDCGSDLVGRHSGEPRPEAPNELDFEQVQLCVVSGEIHARLLRDVLTSQRIPARLQSGWPSDGLSHLLRLPPPFGSSESAPIRVYVNRMDLPRARQIYDDFERTGIQQTQWEEPPDDSDEEG